MLVEFIYWYWIYSANNLPHQHFPGAQFAGNKKFRDPICRQKNSETQFAAKKISGAQFDATKIFQGPICKYALETLSTKGEGGY